MKLTATLHKKFRAEAAKVRRKTYFDKKRKAFFRWLPKSQKRYLRGVHRTVAKRFGSLKKLIHDHGGCDTNGKSSKAGKTSTSRGSRIGKELCVYAEMGPSDRNIPPKAHSWTKMVVEALKKWEIYLIDGEVPVSRGNLATGVDLMGVKYFKKDLTWRLVCIELKSGYRGSVWDKAPENEPLVAPDVAKTVKNYALTQLELTHICAQASFKEFVFEKPLLVRVNVDGVSKCSPTPAVQALAKTLLFRH